MEKDLTPQSTGRLTAAGDRYVIHNDMKNKFIEYELILETHNAGDQAFIKSLLDAEGINYFIQGEHVAHFLYNAIPVRLMVRKEHATRAREILKDVELSYSYGGLNDTEDFNDNEKG